MLWERIGNIKSHLSFFAHYFLYFHLKNKFIVWGAGKLLYYEQIQISIKPGLPRSITVENRTSFWAYMLLL